MHILDRFPDLKTRLDDPIVAGWAVEQIGRARETSTEGASKEMLLASCVGLAVADNHADAGRRIIDHLAAGKDPEECTTRARSLGVALAGAPAWVARAFDERGAKWRQSLAALAPFFPAGAPLAELDALVGVADPGRLQATMDLARRTNPTRHIELLGTLVRAVDESPGSGFAIAGSSASRCRGSSTCSGSWASSDSNGC